MTRQTHSRTDNQSGVHQEKHSLQTKDSDYGPIKPPLLKTCFPSHGPRSPQNFREPNTAENEESPKFSKKPSY